MELNATLLAQLFSFSLFVALFARFAWPPFIEMLEARQKAIAVTLADAKRCRAQLEEAQQHCEEQVQAAQAMAKQILREAQLQKSALLQDAAHEAEQLIQAKRLEAEVALEAEKQVALEKLQQDQLQLALEILEKLLGEAPPEALHRKLVEGVLGAQE